MPSCIWSIPRFPIKFSHRKARSTCTERKIFIDNLLVRILMMRWTGLAPWKFESPYPGSLTSTFQAICSPTTKSACHFAFKSRQTQRAHPPNHQHSRATSTPPQSPSGRPAHRIAKRSRGGLVFKAQRILYHSNLGSRVIKKKKKHTRQQPRSTCTRKNIHVPRLSRSTSQS